jgi:hypothetical protein
MADRKVLHPARRIGLICAITSLIGRDRWLRKIGLSVRNSAVRFVTRGVRSGIQRSRLLRIRRKSKPRNPKRSPCVRSTCRVFSSFTSTWSVANSSRSRRSTAARSQRWRGCPSLGLLALRPGDSLTIPKMALSVGFIRFVSSTDATRATGLLTLTLVGLIRTEHVCLVWTHSLLKTPNSL